MNSFMKLAINSAIEGVNNNNGGPFGACIIKNDMVVSCCHNTVLCDNDPTAHAEINAIRKACKKLNTYDLSGCILYTTSEPCPMCMSAIIWSNIKQVYYGTSRVDVEKIGFRDKTIYDYLSNPISKKIVMKSQIDYDCCLKVFDNYNNKIY